MNVLPRNGTKKEVGELGIKEAGVLLSLPPGSATLAVKFCSASTAINLISVSHTPGLFPQPAKPNHPDSRCLRVSVVGVLLAACRAVLLLLWLCRRVVLLRWGWQDGLPAFSDSYFHEGVLWENYVSAPGDEMRVDGLTCSVGSHRHAERL